MEGEAVKLARQGIELWNAHDLASVYALWDEGVIVRPDPYFPDSEVIVGEEGAQRFWESQRDAMGFGRIELLEEHDLGDRCLMRCRQHVEAPASGIEGSYDWSFLATVRDGRFVMYEFFIDRERGLAAAGLGAEQG